MMQLEIKWMVAGLLACAQMQAVQAKPNVVLVVCDDLNDYITGIPGQTGHPQSLTPNVEKLARSGVAFRRAYVRLRVHWAYWRKSSPAEVAKPVVESNCVAVMRGGEQQETNRQSAG